MAEGAVSTPAPTTVPSLNCADGWNRVLSRNVCFKVKITVGTLPRSWLMLRLFWPLQRIFNHTAVAISVSHRKFILLNNCSALIKNEKSIRLRETKQNKD